VDKLPRAKHCRESEPPNLPETIAAGAEEGEEAEVAEDLELLVDFVANVGVVGMEFR
jgi:hypothetical protein